jgi:hypothetical protein
MHGSSRYPKVDKDLFFLSFFNSQIWLNLLTNVTTSATSQIEKLKLNFKKTLMILTHK